MKDNNTAGLNVLPKYQITEIRKPYSRSHGTENWKIHLPQREPSMRNTFRYSSFKSTTTKHIGSSPEAGPTQGTKDDLKHISDGLAQTVVHKTNRKKKTNNNRGLELEQR